MTASASMGVDIYNVSIHDWANNALRTPSHLPLHFHHALPAPMLDPSCLPKGSCTWQDDIQHLRPMESMAVADQREENSFHPKAPLQEEEAKHAFTNKIDYQSKTWDLPCPSCGLHLQSWLLCGRTVKGITCLSPSEGVPVYFPTNLHRRVERS